MQNRCHLPQGKYVCTRSFRKTCRVNWVFSDWSCSVERWRTRKWRTRPCYCYKKGFGNFLRKKAKDFSRTLFWKLNWRTSFREHLLILIDVQALRTFFARQSCEDCWSKDISAFSVYGSSSLAAYPKGQIFEQVLYTFHFWHYHSLKTVYSRIRGE